MIDPLLEAFADHRFASGLRPALVALAVGALLALLARAAGRRVPLPVAGALLAAAATAGLDDAGLLPPRLGPALLLLLAGGLVADVARLPAAAPALLAAPGAWLLATRTGLVEVTWIRLLVAATVVVGAALVADFDARWRSRGAAPALWAVTALGVYATVPDTEQALVLLGASLPLALLGWPWPAASFGAGGSAAVVGLLAWTAAAGGFGRPSSVVGAVGCLGLLVAEPLGHGLSGARRGWFRAVAGRRRFRAVAGRRLALVAIGTAHLVLVAFESRVAGLRPTVGPAAVLGTGALLLAVAAGVVVARRSEDEVR